MAALFGDLTLEQWCASFTETNKSDWEGLGSANVWLGFVVTATTSIAELVRLDQRSALIEAVGNAFGWLCSFVGYYSVPRKGEPFRFTLPLSEMIWHKYPGACYRCTHKLSEAQVQAKEYLPCLCLSIPTLSDSDKAITNSHKELARKSKPRPTTLDEWTLMTRAIYGPNHREYSLSTICLHFLEEVGEVARELRKLHDLDPLTEPEKKQPIIAEMQDEIADVFSWTMGLLNKVDQTLEDGRVFYVSQGLGADLPPIMASSVAAAALGRARAAAVR